MIPDKVYLFVYASPLLHRDVLESHWAEEQSPLVKENICYIRKDALLEWAKELKGQVCSLHPNNRDATCARDGMLTIIDNIFDKLNNF